ncbi:MULTISPECIES: hypothetical protein [unclassified Microcoleus]|uniref:hypothetical protein n=1 Tax=unclassified Microcoleus TaxID=2642155 RepID=UPI00403F6474
MIESVGARVICLSPSSPDFNPLKIWWSQLKSSLRMFSPKTPEIIGTIIAVALNLMNRNEPFKTLVHSLLLLYLIASESAVIWCLITPSFCLFRTANV